MPNPFILRRALIAAKEEVTEGTAIALAAADADILAENINWAFEVPYFMRDAVSASFSKFAGTSGGPRLCRLTFDVRLNGSGVAITPASWGKLVKACSFGEAITTDVQYEPITALNKSYTIGWYIDGLFYQMFGARGTWTLRMVSGEPAVLSFEFLGVYTKPADTAILAGVTYETAVPPALLSGTMDIETVSVKSKTLEIVLGNVLAAREDPGAPNGVFSVVITNREPNGSLDPEMTDVATKDWYNTLETSGEFALQGIIGATVGNIIEVDAPNAQYELLTPGDRDGILTNQMTLRLCRNLGDDEVKITTK